MLVEEGFSVLDHMTITSLHKASRTWQREILNPLRLVRKQIGKMEVSEARLVYKSLKSSELDAEKAEQAVLLQVLDGKLLSKAKSYSQGDVIQNLSIYLSLLKESLNTSDNADILFLAQRGFHLKRD